MTNEDRVPVTRYMRRMLSAQRAGGLTDAQLLERFIALRDEASFEVLVWRHGPMVLGVCRHVLRHEQDAEDAFQATFLVLVRKASSIGKRRAVGSWLYRVAFRVALRAKLLAGKRGARQTAMVEEPAAQPSPDPVWGDLRPVLDEEINRLPEKYRAPFVLCYLNGKTNEAAAQELGCPKGTILSRLSWARERLRNRLTRRGLDLSVGLSAAALTPNNPVVPAALLDSTLNATLLVAAGKSATDVVSAKVAALTQGVIQTMLWTKIKIVAGCVLVVGCLLAGSALTWQTLQAKSTTSQVGDAREAQAEPPDRKEPPLKSDKDPDKADKPPDKKTPPKPPDAKTFEFEMRDKSWSAVFEWYSEVSGLAYVGTCKPSGTATFIPPKGKRYSLRDITDIINEMLISLPGKDRFHLIRRDTTFTVLPADERIDPSLIPRVLPADLGLLGRTELVSISVTLENMRVKEVGPELKKLLGTFGEVVSLDSTNKLILTDTAGNLAQAYGLILEFEERGAERKREMKKQLEKLAEEQKKKGQ